MNGFKPKPQPDKALVSRFDLRFDFPPLTPLAVPPPFWRRSGLPRSRLHTCHLLPQMFVCYKGNRFLQK